MAKNIAQRCEVMVAGRFHTSLRKENGAAEATPIWLLLAAFAARLGGALAIIREITIALLGPVATIALALLASFATGFRSALRIILKVSTGVLAALSATFTGVAIFICHFHNPPDVSLFNRRGGGMFPKMRDAQPFQRTKMGSFAQQECRH